MTEVSTSFSRALSILIFKWQLYYSLEALDYKYASLDDTMLNFSVIKATWDHLSPPGEPRNADSINSVYGILYNVHCTMDT